MTHKQHKLRVTHRSSSAGGLWGRGGGHETVAKSSTHLSHQFQELLQSQLELQAALRLAQPHPVHLTPRQRCTAVVLLQ